MREYYSSSVYCPACLEPYASEIPDITVLTEYGDGRYHCGKCEAEFRFTIPVLSKHEDFPPKVRNELHPLYRKVRLNYIEDMYKLWLCRYPKGIHLITWPWKDVRFLPIAVTEFAEKHPNVRVVILGDYDRDTNPCDIIRNLYYIENKCESNWIKIKKQDLEHQIYHKRDVIAVKVKKHGLPDQTSSYVKYDSLQKTRNSLIKSLADTDFSIRSVDPPLNKNSKITIDPINGVWILEFKRYNEWSGSRLQYNIAWMKTVLENKHEIQCCKDVLHPVFFKGGDNISQDIHSNIIFLSPDLESPEKIYDIIQKLSPEIVLITNPDTFIADIRYSGEQSRKMMDFLRSTLSTVIMFSTDTECRQYYSLDRVENIFSEANVIIHSVDTDHVLSVMSQKMNGISVQPSPCSSGHIRSSHTDNLHISYCDLETGIFNLVKPLQGFAIGKDLSFFVRGLISSPLNTADYDDRKQFKAIQIGSDSGFSYAWIKDTLMEQAEKDLLPQNDVTALLDRIEIVYGSSQNPLRDKFLECATDILSKHPNGTIIFVVGDYERSGFRLLLNERDAIPITNYYITSWKKLPRLFNKLDMSDQRQYTIISSKYPSMRFKLSDSPVKNFIFISDSYGVESIKKIIDKRLQEQITRPVVHPKSVELLPEPLADIIRSLPDESPEEVIAEIYADEDEDYLYTSRKNVSSIEGQVCSADDEPSRKLNEGSDVILCVDSENFGLFLPTDVSVMILKGELFDEVETSLKGKELENALLGKELIIGKTQLYSSFRSIFFKYMITHKNNLKFERAPYQWETYKEMYHDSVEWIRYISQSIDFIKKSEGIQHAKAEEIIINKLIQANITARDPNTIRLWLKSISTVTIGGVKYDIYRTEHPFRESDVRNIFDTLRIYLYDSNKADPEKSYAASVVIQNIRTKVLKGGRALDDKSIRRIYDGLKRERAEILTNATTFTPTLVRKETLLHPVDVMKIYKDYNSYID